ncbi:unannotated protein [freshwater metagenome]|uniref:Unannotated protein n=1 Tax=freshwater metagenome TaxID=449393 RepID=A0A6J7JTB0_9ZZZZ|nr:sulfatase-like hydrolase/transferase [Actinomycetota bacterium]
MDSSADQAPAHQHGVGSSIKREGWALIELISLAGIAIAQPTFETEKFNAAALSATGATLPLLILFTFIVILVPAIFLWAIELPVEILAPKLRPRLHNLLLSFLVSIILFEALGSTTAFELGQILGVSIIGGLFFSTLVTKYALIKTFIRVLAFAAPVFGALFLLSAPIQSILPTQAKSPSLDAGKANRVVMIVMDELSVKTLLDGDGKIDGELFPNFAALASDSHWFRNTTSVAPFTQVALPAVASGEYPANAADLPTAKAFPNTIFSLLGDSYKVTANEISSERLCPLQVCPLKKPQGFLHLEKAIVRNAVDLWWSFASLGPGADFGCFCDAWTELDGLRQGQRFISGIQPSSEPSFNYVHLLIPHAPWLLTPSGQSYEEGFSVPKGLTPELKWSSKVVAEANKQQYLLQLQAGDKFLGSVVTRLRTLGLYDDSLIVLTADHGVSFRNGSGYRIIDKKNYSDILWVPLFIKEPGNLGGGTIDDRPASTVDIVPTMADALDVKIPWRQDGVSLLQAPVARSPRKFLGWPSGFSFLPPSETKYSGFDEESGFAEVLATPAINPGVAAGTRMYAIDGSSGYANLIGTKPESLLDLTKPRTNAIYTNPGDYLHVRPDASYAPWALLKGGLAGDTQGLIAVAVNGTIRAISRTLPTYLNSPGFSVPLPTSAFIYGANKIDVYRVGGTSESPSLIPVKLLQLSGET